MDAGDIWSSNNYPMREVSKSVIYRHEATRAAIKRLIDLLNKIKLYKEGKFNAEKLDYLKPDVKGCLMPIMKQIDRKINWQTDSTEEIVRKIRSADSNPGVLDNIFGEEYYLYGSEYWTYLLPKRVGKEMAMKIIDKCQPVGTMKAQELGLIDDYFGLDNSEFIEKITEVAEELAMATNYESLIGNKKLNRKKDEQSKSLLTYREEELEHMGVNFYGQDRSYHISRNKFVYKIDCATKQIILNAI